MHSEHDLKERQRRTNHSESFSLWDATLLHNRGASRHRHLERSCMLLWETDRNRSHDTLSREISRRNATRTIRGGDFSTLWRLCIESPSQPKLASSLHNKRLSYWRLTGFGRNDGDGGQRFCHSSPSEMTGCCLPTPSSRAEDLWGDCFAVFYSAP